MGSYSGGGGGGGASCPGQFILPPNYITKVKFWMLIPLISNYLNEKTDEFKHNSSQIQLFSLSHCFVCLVAGVGGGKLSGEVYLAPNPLTSKK